MSHTETLDKSFEKLLEWHRRGVSRNTSSLDDEASELAHEAALDLYREEGV
jgi:DNA-directed RNA polymerase specialized sigma24 family protein